MEKPGRLKQFFSAALNSLPMLGAGSWGSLFFIQAIDFVIRGPEIAGYLLCVHL